MPLDLSEDEAGAYLRRGEAPGPLLDLVATMATHAVAAAIRLGILDVLADGPRDSDQIADRLGTDPYATRILLDTLAATGYLERDHQGFSLTPTSRWLLSDAEGGFGRTFTFWFTLIDELWGDLSSAVRAGKPGADFYGWLEQRPDVAGPFHAMQAGLARWLAEEAVSLAPAPAGATRLLDLGGGHGEFSAAYCAAHPGLTATVVDLPAALAVDSPQWPESVASRIRRREGNLTDPVSERDQDVVLLFNVVHGFEPPVARRLIGEGVAALRPGGALLVMETCAPVEHRIADRAFTECFALNLWHTQGGHVYPVETLERWIRLAGCPPPERHQLTRSNSHVILAARKPGEPASGQPAPDASGPEAGPPGR